MRAIIVDDEQPAIDMLNVLLAPKEQIAVVGTYRKPAEALAAIAELKPDVAFLDIQMPHMSGLELAERMLSEHDEMEIVFITAYDHYALEAFRAGAIDYLLKPIMENELDKTISKLLKRLRPAAAEKPPERMTQHAPAIYAFGEFTVSIGGERQNAAQWRTVKAQELMAYLFINRGKSISKWEIINDLWPDCSTDQAHSHLHTTMYQVRKTLKYYEINAVIHFRNSHYRLEMDELVSDVEQFELLPDDKEPIMEHNLTLSEQRLALYKGDLFGSWSYSWSTSLKERYKERFVATTKRVCQFLADSGQHQAAVLRCQQLIALQPLDEEAYVLLLLLYRKLNNRTAFMALYRRLEDMLGSELGIQPEESVRQLYEHWPESKG